MDNMKKLLALILTAALAVSVFAGCAGGSGDAGASESADEGASDSPSESGDGGDGMRIAIVTSPSGVDDGSFNQDNYNGILRFIGNHPDATVTTINEPTGDPAASVQAVADIVADYDVIVTPGFQFAGISTLAAENPEKRFILVDSDPEEVDGQGEFDNIFAMTFKEQESGFFAGMAAALETQSGKVAVVNGVAYPSNVNYQYGFESGVNYAKALYGLSVEMVEIASYAGTDVFGENVGGNYVGDFNDEPTGKVVGAALIAEGCDIIFVAAGNSGNGVFTAAKEAGSGVLVIGCDVDQYDEGVNGDANIILTSALKVMDINVERALNAIKDGSFKGENVLLGADTDSTGYVAENGRHQMSDDTLTALQEAYGLLKNGTIVPAGQFTDTAPEDFLSPEGTDSASAGETQNEAGSDDMPAEVEGEEAPDGGEAFVDEDVA